MLEVDFGLGLHESATPLPLATYRSGKSPSQPGSFLAGSDLPLALPEYSHSSGRKQGSRMARDRLQGRKPGFYFCL